MTKPSSLTMTFLTLRNCAEFGFYFVCSTCLRESFGTLELGRDGIELLESKSNSSHPNWLPSKLSAVQRKTMKGLVAEFEEVDERKRDAEISPCSVKS